MYVDLERDYIKKIIETQIIYGSWILSKSPNRKDYAKRLVHEGRIRRQKVPSGGKIIEWIAE